MNRMLIVLGYIFGVLALAGILSHFTPPEIPVTSNKLLSGSILWLYADVNPPLFVGETHTYTLQCELNTPSTVQITNNGVTNGNMVDVTIAIAGGEPYHQLMDESSAFVVTPCSDLGRRYKLGWISEVHRTHIEVFYKELPEPQ